MVACANCGRENSPGLKFCTSCGKPLIAPAPTPPTGAAGRNCLSCGASIPEGMKFCVKCGKPLREAVQPPVAATLPPPLLPPAPFVAAPPPPPPAPPVRFVATPPPPPSWLPPVPSGGIAGTQAEPIPTASALPPGPPPKPQKSVAGMIIAALVVVAALGGGGYYGYSRWGAKEVQPGATAAAAQPPAAVQRPPGQVKPSQPQPSGKLGNTPPASVSNGIVPPRPAQLPAGEPAPLRPAPPAVAPAAPSGTSTPAAQKISVGGNVQKAMLIRQVPPTYPPLAKQARVSGEVRLRLVVGTDGAVKEVTVVSGHPLLIQAAIDAVRQWLYRPTVVNGVPVEVLTEVAVNFTLTGS